MLCLAEYLCMAGVFWDGWTFRNLFLFMLLLLPWFFVDRFKTKHADILSVLISQVWSFHLAALSFRPLLLYAMYERQQMNDPLSRCNISRHFNQSYKKRSYHLEGANTFSTCSCVSCSYFVCGFFLYGSICISGENTTNTARLDGTVGLDELHATMCPCRCVSLSGRFSKSNSSDSKWRDVLWCILHWSQWYVNLNWIHRSLNVLIVLISFAFSYFELSFVETQPCKGASHPLQRNYWKLSRRQTKDRETMHSTALSFHALNMHFLQKLSDDHFRQCRMLQLSLLSGCYARRIVEIHSTNERAGAWRPIGHVVTAFESGAFPIKIMQHDPNLYPNLVFCGGFDCLMSNFDKSCVNYLSTGVKSRASNALLHNNSHMFQRVVPRCQDNMPLILSMRQIGVLSSRVVHQINFV